MTGDAIFDGHKAYDPCAEAAISAGLGAYNAEKFRPADTGDAL